jgi:hypothetical protein
LFDLQGGKEKGKAQALDSCGGSISSGSRARALHSSRFIHQGGANLVCALFPPLRAFACFYLWLCVWGTGNAGAVHAVLETKGERRGGARGDKNRSFPSGIHTVLVVAVAIHTVLMLPVSRTFGFGLLFLNLGFVSFLCDFFGGG